MDGRLWPRADLRVGDADRQAVVDELQRHYVDGRLTSEELGERVTSVWSAKTFGDLAVQLADLPVLPRQDLATAESTPAEADAEGWQHPGFSTALAPVLVMVGMMLLLIMFTAPYHFGFGGFWLFPLIFWGFFSVGRRPHSGRSGRWPRGGPPTHYQ